jgi:coproporphyrinogen III oxidase
MDNWKRERAGMPGATQAVYDGEVTIQAGFNTSLLFGAAGSEAYDEPLTGAEATAIASLFIVA